MRTLILLLALLCQSGIVTASDTARIDGKIVTTGMTVAEVSNKVGGPDRTVQLENVYGAGVGEQWEYWRGKKMFTLTVQHGKVVSIDER